MDTKASSAWILPLEVQDLFEKRQAHLIVGVLRGTRSVIFQARKTIVFKRVDKRVDMGTRQLEAVGNALFVPALGVHAHHGPPRLIGIGEARKGREAELTLPWRLIGL
jgi:hypothetical protein